MTFAALQISRRASCSINKLPISYSSRQYARSYSYYPPPEPFISSRFDASSPSKAPSAIVNDAPISTSSPISTFGATPSLLSSFLAIPPTSLTMSSLLYLGGSPGVPPSEAQLLHSARFTARELPIRLARRVDQYRSLPFIVGSNPYIAKIAKLYASSFDSLASMGFDNIQTLKDNDRFAAKLEEMVQLHSENVPTLARGFLECKKYMSSSAISTFLNGAIHSRIGIRLIAEQHMALSHAFRTGKTSTPYSVGIIDTKVNAYDLIKQDSEFVEELCESTLGESPEIKIEGSREATFVGVASHLSYCVKELLKNSYRATVERHLNHYKRNPEAERTPIPPIFVSIAKSKQYLSIRIRDRGGGIAPKNLPHIFNYTFTTVPNEEEKGDSSIDDAEMGPYAMQSMPSMGGSHNDALGALTTGGSGSTVGLGSALGTLAGLGYGLPMSRIYAEHGRGSLDIVSLYGHGCDTFIKVRANPLEMS
ncbi:hypothetical protein L7F22_019628 [Adiantum nelumboides]|nr:hypothetical protein [Adiantum nelumboides]